MLLSLRQRKLEIQQGLPCKIKSIILILIVMKFFKNIPAEKIGNFILTVITAFVSTFLMQSCMSI